MQQEFARIKQYMEKHNLVKYGYGGDIRPFTPKIICGDCGCIYGRKAHAGREAETYWQCNTRCNNGPKSCRGVNIKERVIHRVFIEAWNSVVANQESLSIRWEEMEKTGTELEAVRARQMRSLVKNGSIRKAIPELVLTVLESITVKGNATFEVRFLDGTALSIQF